MKICTFCAAGAIASLALLASVPAARAASQAVTFDSLNASATAPVALVGGSNLLMNTLVTNATGALSQTISFTIGAGVTSVIGSAAWEVTTGAGSGPRLIGVNIDIFDAQNKLVLSDEFTGALAGFATSTFAGGLTPGTYTLIAAGSAVRAASLDVSLSFVGAPAARRPIEPAAALTTAVRTHELISSSVSPTPLFAGDTLYLDTLVSSGDTGDFRQSLLFTVGAGVREFTGNVAWEVSTAAGTGPRLNGVNIDILDAADQLVASDTFAGALGGFAFSTFDDPLAPGTYTLVATGRALRDASFNLSLSFGGAAAPVPESGTGAMMLGGLALLAGMAPLQRRIGAARPIDAGTMGPT